MSEYKDRAYLEEQRAHFTKHYGDGFKREDIPLEHAICGDIILLLQRVCAELSYLNDSRDEERAGIVPPHIQEEIDKSMAERARRAREYSGRGGRR